MDGGQGVLTAENPHMFATTSGTTGRAKFGLDVTPKGTVFAMIARCPVLGGMVESVDAASNDIVEVQGSAPRLPLAALWVGSDAGECLLA